MIFRNAMVNEKMHPLRVEHLSYFPFAVSITGMNKVYFLSTLTCDMLSKPIPNSVSLNTVNECT